MKYLRIPWGMRAMKELGLTPALCHPDRTILFPAEKMPERKKPPESLFTALRGLCIIHWAPMFLTPMHGCYSISIRLGFTGRAFCCCGAGSVMCRMPSSNFAWMSSFFTASPT